MLFTCKHLCAKIVISDDRNNNVGGIGVGIGVRIGSGSVPSHKMVR